MADSFLSRFCHQISQGHLLGCRRLCVWAVKWRMPRSLTCHRLGQPTYCKPTSRHAVTAWHLQCTAAQDVIVVGGGVGGLATAGRLARKGLRVTVLEKNQEVGPWLLAGRRPARQAGSQLVPAEGQTLLCSELDSAAFGLSRMPACLLEQVGGRAQSVELGGCRFDTGPSLLLFPDKYREVDPQGRQYARPSCLLLGTHPLLFLLLC